MEMVPGCTQTPTDPDPLSDPLCYPDSSYLQDFMYSHIPPGVSIGVNETSTEVEVEFKDKSRLIWVSTIGKRLAPVYSSMHFSSSLAFSMTRNFIPHGFLKAVQVTLHDGYLKKIQDDHHPLLHLDLPMRYHMSIPYVAEKAYVWGGTTYSNGDALFTNRNLVIGVNMKTRKPAKLNAEWSNMVLRHNQDRGLPNESFKLPSFEHISLPELVSFRITVTLSHLDLNMHVNYKVYIFGLIVCIRKALTAGKMTRFHDASLDDVISRDMIVVFERECNIGDGICFRLFDSDSDVFTAACYKGDTRLAYGQYQLQNLCQTSLSRL